MDHAGSGQVLPIIVMDLDINPTKTSFPISMLPHLILVKKQVLVWNENVLYILHFGNFCFQGYTIIRCPSCSLSHKKKLLISKHTKEYHIISNDSTNL